MVKIVRMLDKDHGDRDAALKRGLASELGVTACRAARLPLNLRIVKTYKEQPGVFNRELVDLYLVAADDEAQITSASPKITNLQWMDWHRFRSLVNAEPERFTKTGQFYFSDKILLPFIEASSYAFLFNKEPPAPPNSAILHVDRWPGSKTTFRGQIGDILRQSGEVIYG